APARPRRGKRGLGRYAFLLPAAVFVALFSLYPLAKLAWMSLSDVTSATLNQDWDFTGLANYIEGFTSGATTEALWLTLVFVVVVTAVGMIGGLAAAIALRPAGRWSEVALAVTQFLLADDGLVNLLARTLGLTDGSFPFLYAPSWALWSVAFVNSWAVIPFNALVFRAALLNISPSIFEAAALDGASRWQEVRH